MARTEICKTIETYDKSWINNILKAQNNSAVSSSLVSNAKYVGIPAAFELTKAAIVKYSTSVAAEAIAGKLPYIGWAITAIGVGDAISSAIQTQRLQGIFDEMDKVGGHVRVVTVTYADGPPGKRYHTTHTYVYYMVGETAKITMSGNTITLA